MRVTDEDVGRYLRMFTLLSHEELEAITSEHQVLSGSYYTLSLESHGLTEGSTRNEASPKEARIRGRGTGTWW